MLRPNSPIGEFFSWIYNLLMLSILYLAFSVPVFTVGAAVIALYEEVYAVREGREGIIFKDFFDAFRRNFRMGLGMLLFYAVEILLIGGIGGALILVNVPVRPALLLSLAVVGGIGCWVAALAGRFEQKLTVTVRNAYLIGIRNLPVTLLLSLINFGIPALVWLLPQEFLRWYLFALLFFVPAGCAFLTSFVVLRVLEKQYPEQSVRDETQQRVKEK